MNRIRNRPLDEGKMDRLPGSKASSLGRLVLIIVVAAFQYWLFTTALEADQAGNQKVPTVAFIVSVFCFLLAMTLMIKGELSAKSLNDEIQKDEN